MTARDPASAIVILSGVRRQRAEGGDVTVVNFSGVPVPDDVHDALFAEAVARGVSVEQVAAEKLGRAVKREARKP
jgi:hypothetical protein